MNEDARKEADTLLARFGEPSSWAGIGGMVAIFGVSIPPGLTQSLTLIGAGIAQTLAFALRERR